MSPTLTRLPPRLLPGLVAAVFALLGGARPAAAQMATLRVTVVDSATRAPVAQARVQLVGGPGGVTGDDGSVLLRDVYPGTEVVQASLLGYADRRVLVQVAPDGAMNLVVALHAVPLRLDVLEARSDRRSRMPWLRSFYARAESGPGEYFTRADIERMRPREVSDLFRIVPGMVLSVSPEGDTSPRMVEGTISFRSDESVRGGGAGARSSCPILWFVDGSPIEPTDGRIDTEIDPAEVEGIEIYRRTTLAPAQYRRGHSNCGVVLIWKRERIDRA